MGRKLSALKTPCHSMYKQPRTKTRSAQNAINATSRHATIHGSGNVQRHNVIRCAAPAAESSRERAMLPFVAPMARSAVSAAPQTYVRQCLVFCPVLSPASQNVCRRQCLVLSCSCLSCPNPQGGKGVVGWGVGVKRWVGAGLPGAHAATPCRRARARRHKRPCRFVHVVQHATNHHTKCRSLSHLTITKKNQRLPGWHRVWGGSCM